MHDRYIAVGVSSACSVTANGGTSWAAKTLSPAGSYRAITRHGSRLVAVGDAGACSTSDDGGDTWTSRTFGRAVALYGVASDGAMLVAVGFDAASYSTDGGETWTAHDPGAGLNALAVARGAGTWLMVGEGAIVKTWTGNPADGWVDWPLPRSMILTALAWTGYQFAGAESTPDSAATSMVTAIDGKLWIETQELIPRYGFNAAAWTGRVLCLVGAGIATSAPL